MSARFDRLAARRAELVAQSDKNRAAVASSFGVIEQRLSLVERVVDVARRVRRHRGIVTAVTVGLILAGRGSRPRLRRAAQFLPIVIEIVRAIRSRRERDAV